jgi:hypothetical protein
VIVQLADRVENNILRARLFFHAFPFYRKTCRVIVAAAT